MSLYERVFRVAAAEGRDASNGFVTTVTKSRKVMYAVTRSTLSHYARLSVVASALTNRGDLTPWRNPWLGDAAWNARRTLRFKACIINRRKVSGKVVAK